MSDELRFCFCTGFPCSFFCGFKPPPINLLPGNSKNAAISTVHACGTDGILSRIMRAFHFFFPPIPLPIRYTGFLKIVFAGTFVAPQLWQSIPAHVLTSAYDPHFGHGIMAFPFLKKSYSAFAIISFFFYNSNHGGYKIEKNKDYSR